MTLIIVADRSLYQVFFTEGQISFLLYSSVEEKQASSDVWKYICKIEIIHVLLWKDYQCWRDRYIHEGKGTCNGSSYLNFVYGINYILLVLILHVDWKVSGSRGIPEQNRPMRCQAVYLPWSSHASQTFTTDWYFCGISATSHSQWQNFPTHHSWFHWHKSCCSGGNN